MDAGNLSLIYDFVHLKPSVVQNPFFAENGYDAELRRFCKDRAVGYQAFWVLKKNKRLCDEGEMRALIEKLDVSDEALLLWSVAKLEDLGSVLNGSSNLTHLERDLRDWERIDEWYEGEVGEGDANEVRRKFRELLGVK